MNKINGINVLSLFDGISCGQIALNNQRIKIDKYFASEVEDKSIFITQKNYPNTFQLGDVREVNVYDDIDLLCGGSPCTNLSLVGDRSGLICESLDDYIKLKKDGFDFGKNQSYLFWEYIRILKEVKPKYFLLENVRMSKKSEQLITKILGVEPIVINSELVSAQKRLRYYWTNIPNVKQPKRIDITLSDILESGYTEKDKSYCLTASYAKSSIQNYFIKSERQFKFLNPIERINNSYYLYDGNVIEIEPSLGVKHNKNKLEFLKKYTSKLIPLECERLQGLVDGYTEGVANVHRYRMIGNGWNVPTIEHLFKNMEF